MKFNHVMTKINRLSLAFTIYPAFIFNRLSCLDVSLKSLKLILQNELFYRDRFCELLQPSCGLLVEHGDGCKIYYQRATRCVKSPSCARNNNFTALASRCSSNGAQSVRLRNAACRAQSPEFFKSIFLASMAPRDVPRRARTRSKQDKPQRMTCSLRKNSRCDAKVNKRHTCTISAQQAFLNDHLTRLINLNPQHILEIQWERERERDVNPEM